MNTTNRAANRFLILVVGLVLLVLGAAAAATALVPAVREPVTGLAGDAPATVSGWLQATPIGGTGTSWIPVALLAVLAVAVLLLLRFVLRQGSGRTSRIVQDRSGITVETAVAGDLLEEALKRRSELVSSSVSSYDVQGTPVLKISVVARRGVSPTVIAEVVEDSLHSLDLVLGTRIPALLQIGGGFRTRLAKTDRVH